MIDRRAALAFLLPALLAGCGGPSAGGGGGGPRGPAPDQTLTQLFNLQQVYQRLGRLAAGPPVPFVGSVDVVAGPGDSALVTLGLSLQSRALVFQRQDAGFTARYRVDVALQRGEEPPLEFSRTEVVRVGSFQETQRNEESVVFRQAVMLVPGRYRVTVQVQDLVARGTSRAEGTYEIRSFPPRSVAGPIIAYRATPRAGTGQPLDLVPNPRGAVTYGGDSLRVYLEAYGFPGPHRVPFEVRDERDSVLYRDSLAFQGGRALEARLVRLAPTVVPLGELKLAIGTGPSAQAAGLLVTFSQAWMVTNFTEMLNLLRYFGQPELLDALRKAPEADRPRLWREFWTATDPNPVTPENEALDLYFQRVAVANARYRDEGMQGWRTDRGEVFISLGDPDEQAEAGATTQRRYLRWAYTSHRLVVTFVDETGFGRFRLTPSSRAEFERVVQRIRRGEP